MIQPRFTLDVIKAVLVVAVFPQIISAQDPKPMSVSLELPRTKHLGVHNAAFSLTGQYFATAGRGGIRLWRSDSATIEAEVDAHRFHNQSGPGERTSVTGIAFLDHDRTLMTAGEDGNIAFWSVPDMKLVRSLSEPLIECVYSRTFRGRWFAWYRCPIRTVAVSPDGRTIARAIRNNIKIIDTATGETIREVGSVLRTVEFDLAELIPKESQIDAQKWKEVYLRDWLHFSAAESQAQPDLAEVKYSTSDEKVTCLSFSPNGTLLAASDPENAYLWDWRTGELLHTIPGSSCHAFSHDGNLIATGDARTPIVIWEIRQWRKLMTMEVRARGLAFSAKGDSLFVKGDDHVRRFSLRTGHEVECFDPISSDSSVQTLVTDSVGSVFGGIWRRDGVFRRWRLVVP